MRSHEARRRKAAAAAEGNQRVTARKPMAVLCLRRTVRYHCASEGAGLAGFIASAVTVRSSPASSEHAGGIIGGIYGKLTGLFLTNIMH